MYGAVPDERLIRVLCSRLQSGGEKLAVTHKQVPSVKASEPGGQNSARRRVFLIFDEAYRAAFPVP